MSNGDYNISVILPKNREGISLSIQVSYYHILPFTNLNNQLVSILKRKLSIRLYKTPIETINIHDSIDGVPLRGLPFSSELDRSLYVSVAPATRVGNEPILPAIPVLGKFFRRFIQAFRERWLTKRIDRHRESLDCILCNQCKISRRNAN